MRYYMVFLALRGLPSLIEGPSLFFNTFAWKGTYLEKRASTRFEEERRKEENDPSRRV